MRPNDGYLGGRAGNGALPGAPRRLEYRRKATPGSVSRHPAGSHLAQIIEHPQGVAKRAAAQ
jgi:hypothetical protein